MNIVNTRTFFSMNSVQGIITVDGNFICFGIEPYDAGFTDDMTTSAILAIKQPRLIENKYTAIPTGTYPLKLAEAPGLLNKMTALKAAGITMLPELQNVKCYAGVFIHVGNFETATNEQSEGCTMLGMTRGQDEVGSSVGAFMIFKEKCFNAIAAGGVTYTIERNNQAWAEFQKQLKPLA